MKWSFFSIWNFILLFMIIAFAVGLGGIIFLRFGIGGATVIVPEITGKDLSEALEIMNELGLNLKIMEKKFNNRVPSGIIISQVPASGETVRKNRAIKIVISMGSEMVAVRDITGMRVLQARRILRKAGLEVGWEATVHHQRASKNNVIAQGIEPGQEAKRNTRISLLISRGPVKSALVMPDFIGRNLETVQKKIEELGLELGVVSFKEGTRFKPGTIIKQAPPLGSRITKGSMVDLSVTHDKSYAKKENRHFFYLRYLKQPGLLDKDALIRVSDNQGIRTIYADKVAPGSLIERVIITTGKPLLKTDQEEKRPKLKNWKIGRAHV